MCMEDVRIGREALTVSAGVIQAAGLVESLLLPVDPHRFAIIISAGGDGFHWVYPKGFDVSLGGIILRGTATYSPPPLVLSLKDHGALVTAEWRTYGTAGLFIYALTSTFARE